jgi:hypothetical protein
MYDEAGSGCHIDTTQRVAVKMGAEEVEMRIARIARLTPIAPPIAAIACIRLTCGRCLVTDLARPGLRVQISNRPRPLLLRDIRESSP